MNRSALEQQLADARTRRDALTTELADLVARLLEIRAALGNPFFYSHPEHPDERKANYTGYASHDAIAPSVLALHRVEEEIRRLERELGHHANDDTPSDT